MGTSTDAILFYGYCWDEEAASPWEIDEDDPDSPEEDWEDRYARVMGHKKTSDYTTKKKFAATSQCEVGSHCSASCPMPYVAVSQSVTLSSRGYPHAVTSLAVDPTWDAILAKFCAVMGIKINKKTPAWWLVSDWSE